ncbi:nucleolar protein dao-5 isoform X20 [Cherax quadricarinatus]|uniref:nucleolar protein dao-5 isoform X20 n=1 Tax=Cherax quadricarinatus TaxID=27406 RepID=UPI0023780816|nr:titin-like isoform X19 [Cherax quadricarinatus]
MINQFWNLCRACPSVNIDKLHSEYRSTYRWHEYTPQSQHEVIRKPPTSQGMGRRRYNWNPAPGGVGSGMQEGGDGEQRVRVSQSEERSRRFLQPSHRSRSEGPLGRDLDDDSFLVSEYKTQFAWVRRTPSARGPEAAPLLEVEKPPQSTKNQVNANGVAGGASGGAGRAAPSSDTQPAIDQQLPRTPRKSKSMGRIHGGGNGPEVGEGAAGGPEAASGIQQQQQQQQQQQGGNQEGQQDQAPPARTDAAGTTPAWHPGHRRTPSDGVAWRHSKGLEADRIIGGEMLGSGEDDKLYKRAYKSEYRKKFRPFSQYQYVDGRFHKVKTDDSSTSATAAATGSGGGGGGGSESPNNWYKEVIELRRQAGQYRARHDIGDVWRTVQHRGWGVETASERLAEIYSKQAELWEQVSRRSSLQALSLASASPSRPISKAEKEIENSRRSSPIKHVSKSSRERPSTAPPKPKPAAVHTQKPSDKTEGKTSKESTPRHHYERTTGTTGGRSVSVGPENRSPKRTSRPPSTHATAPATKPERRPRPSEETDSKKDKEKEILPKDGPKDIMKDLAPKDGSKEPVEAVKESTARKSTPEPRFDPEKYEPVVKTPPEPTRVKSPDQVGKWVMVKSPDPVNWTVPLDTGKTFTVTHNIPEATHCLRIPRGESARGTPSSEYRHVLESRTRQTPEPTKISQGSLAGTPVSSIASEAKSHSQEQPKPTTATTLESKVDDKTDEKKPAPKPIEAKSQESEISESKIPEGKIIDGDSFNSKLDAKAETKPYDIKKDTKLTEVKEEPKLADSKELETKPLEAKVQETEPLESKTPEVKSSEPPVSEPASVLSMFSEPKASEVKDPEPKKLEPVTEFKKAEPTHETKPFQSQPLQQQQQLPLSPPATKKPSPMDIVPPSGAVDSMTMSMFGSLNGMNGKSSGTPSPTKPEVPLLSSDPVKDVCAPESKPVSVRNIPGTNLRCLDDPSFMFDQPSPPTTNSPKSGTYKVLEAPVEPQQSKSGGYRVLEAPEAPSDIKDLPDQSPTKPEAPIKPSPYRVLEAPIDTPARSKGSPYRVLEAPDAPYYPQTQSVGEVQESKPPSLVSPASGRTVSDALDKARTRFDSFWGGPKDKDPPSKV